jgi:hypothetical protein
MLVDDTVDDVAARLSGCGGALPLPATVQTGAASQVMSVQSLVRVP